MGLRLTGVVAVAAALAADCCVLCAAFKVHEVQYSDLGGFDYRIFNNAAGVPIFSREPLWEQSPLSLLYRLGTTFEQTKSQKLSRYSAYVTDRIFGVRSELFKIEEDNGKISEIQIVFFNKGDSVDERWDYKDTRTMQVQEKAITDALTDLFGKYENTRMGSGRNSEKARLWKGAGCEFLLAARNREYITLNIRPEGWVGEEKEDESPERVTMQMGWDKNVEKNSNGDVWIKNMPMVNQGNKGYCMPATIERCILYYGVHDIDMHRIAAAVNTADGGGTKLSSAIANTRKIISPNNLRIDMSQFTFPKIRKYIDMGVPMCWCLFYLPEFRDRLRETAMLRDVGDFEKWVKQSRKMPVLKAKSDTFNTGHVCNIVGYNSTTQEIAISNSWGEAHEIEWVRFKDARAVSLSLFAIRPN